MITRSLLIRRSVVEEDDIFVTLPTGSGKSLMNQKNGLIGIHDSYGSSHLYICRSLFGPFTFLVACSNRVREGHFILCYNEDFYVDQIYLCY